MSKWHPLAHFGSENEPPLITVWIGYLSAVTILMPRTVPFSYHIVKPDQPCCIRSFSFGETK